MPRRREAAQDAPAGSRISLGAAHAGWIISLLVAFAGYCVNEIKSNRDALKDAESAKHEQEVMTRRIEALEQRLLSCGQRGSHG